MLWFYNLKISKKLISVFFIVVVLETLLGLFAIRELHHVNQVTSEISSNWMPSIRTLTQLKLSLARVRIYEMQHIMASNQDEYDEIERVGNNQISEPSEKALFPTLKKPLPFS